jgi:broad specificity phosphatase PhoE
MFVVLHGQTEWNRDGRHQGRLDSPLTDEGRRQVRQAGLILKSHLGDAPGLRVVASPRGRTLATAAIVADCLGLPPTAIETEARLAEIHMGEWEGLTRAEIEAGWPERMNGPGRNGWHFQSPGGEDYDAIADRLRAWLAEQDTHDTLVAVTHGVASRVLRGLYTRLAKEEAFDLEIARDAPFRLADGRSDRLGFL